MRIHRLEVTAFGPFAEHQVIDVDQLSQAGLFLLHGPTGAGKTSILDAVCFALFGRVPGARGSTNGGRLRSDHAPAQVAAEVVCEFTVSGRRMEITRSPEWQRPKKRGEGTVREQAHVVLRELRGGNWQALTNRVDEAAEELHQLIGLGIEQFTKLILLPQGDFAAFLSASAEQRRPLLQKLFGTDRFAEVERWLAEQRRETEHQVVAARALTARLLARAEQARTGHRGAERHDRDPDIEQHRDLDRELDRDPEAAARLIRGWARSAKAQLTAAHADVVSAERSYESARQAAEEATEQARREQRRLELGARYGELQAARPAHLRARAALEAAGHASVLAPVLADLAEAQQQEQAGEEHLRAARAALQAQGQQGQQGEQGGATAAGLNALREELGSLAELVAEQGELAGLDQRHATGLRAIEAAEAGLARDTSELNGLLSRQAELLQARTAADLLAVTLPDRQEAADRARGLAEAVLAAEGVEVLLIAARDELRAAIDTHQSAVELAQLLRARRLDGMAAELAAGLADAQPCPVCGSCDHPAAATASGTPVTAEAQQRAESAQATAAAERERCQHVVGSLAERLAGLQAITAGTGASQAGEQLALAQDRLVEARAAGAQVLTLGAEAASVAGRTADLQARCHQAEARAKHERHALAAISGRRAAQRERLERARGQDRDVVARQRRIAGVTESVERVLAAESASGQAAARARRTRAAAAQAAQAAGFGTLAAAAAAALSEPDRLRLATEVEEYESEIARLEALLADLRPTGPDGQPVLELAGLPTGPTPEVLRAVQGEARQVHEHARERHTLAARAGSELTSIAAELSLHARQSAALRRRFAVLESVSRCAEGTGGDNALKMRLSAYVLTARLEQVAQAASARLAGMSGGRYALVHTDGPARAGARSGLGLAVIDGWTGVQRDPATLSGGETFCTSLALALGLADVVQAEAGGASIETLLVDEGFGSLDEQTLDEVMDVLDGLRSAGRCVGLVSHVADLRDRIPAQLEVVKTRTGSRLIA